MSFRPLDARSHIPHTARTHIRILKNYQKEAKALCAPDEVKKKIIKETERLKSIGNNSAESSVLRGYIETLLDLPWDKASEDNHDLKNAARILDQDHYGLEKVKERVLFKPERRQPDPMSRGPAWNGKNIGGTFHRACARQEIRAHQPRRRTG